MLESPRGRTPTTARTAARRVCNWWVSHASPTEEDYGYGVIESSMDERIAMADQECELQRQAVSPEVAGGWAYRDLRYCGCTFADNTVMPRQVRIWRPNLVGSSNIDCCSCRISSAPAPTSASVCGPMLSPSRSSTNVRPQTLPSWPARLAECCAAASQARRVGSMRGSRSPVPTLIEAMQNACRFVDDEVLRERLMEAKGIGTPATWAEIIGGLKKQALLVAQKKNIVPSEIGLQLFGVLQQADPALVDPGVTAQLECLLDEVVIGKQDVISAIDAVCDVAQRIIGKLQEGASTRQRPLLGTMAQASGCRRA